MKVFRMLLGLMMVLSSGAILANCYYCDNGSSSNEYCVSVYGNKDNAYREALKDTNCTGTWLYRGRGYEGERGSSQYRTSADMRRSTGTSMPGSSMGSDQGSAQPGY